MSQSDWTQEPLRQVATLIMGQSPDSRFYNANGDGMPFLQGCAQFGKTSPDTGIFCSLPAKIAPSGSILFSVRAPVGAINSADQRYCIGRGVAAIVGKAVETDYLRHYLLFLSADFERVSQGSTFSAINSTELGTFPVAYPKCRTAQAKIAQVLATLDRAIAQTDALLAKQQRVKAGLMQELLTRGIDADGNRRDPRTHAFKDSPLGPVPVEWEVKPLGQLFDLINGYAFKPSDWQESGLPIIRIQNLNGSTEFNRYPGAVPAKFIIQKGDLMFAWSGNRGTSFGPFLWQGPVGIVNQHIFKVLPRQGIRLLWAYFSLMEVKDRVEKDAHGAIGLVHVRRVDLVKYMMAVPKPDEQERIENAILALQGTIEHYFDLRAKLQSLKAGLMQHLLTGRVSVAPLLDGSTRP